MKTFMLVRALAATIAAGLALPAAATVTSSFNAGTGTLTISSDAGDALALSCQTGNVALNAVVLAGPTSCAAVRVANVNGGPGSNAISLTAMTAVDFPLLTTVAINGGDSSDTIIGSFLADVIHGDGGDDAIDGNNNPAATVDQVFGDDGNDTMTWNPGKNDDLNEGGAGTDTAVVNGGGGAENFTIAALAGRVRFDRTTNNGVPAPFFVDIGTTERLIVNGNAGDDAITGAAGLNALIALELNGGDNNDTIVGGDGADLIHGGNGDDVLDGNNNPVATVDQVFGDDGNDTMTWNPGKNDDLNEGGPGTDSAVINGGGGAENFTIAAVAGRVHFERTTNNGVPAPFFVDIGTTERLVVNGNAGDDVITGGAGLSALIALELNGGDNNDTIIGGDGADLIHGNNGDDLLDGNNNPAATVDQVFGDDGNDTMTWNPGKNDDLNEGGAGTDTSVIVGGAAAETFTITPDPVNLGRIDFNRTNPTPFFVDIGTTERLIVNGNAGDDVITGAAGLNALIALELNGGDNNDTIVGGDGADLIHGGNGDDIIDGNNNPAATVDQVFGDDGNDTMTWNPGKNDDLNEGGPGTDTSVINGGAATETFTIAPDPVNVGRIDFNRTNPAPFFVDIGSTERLIVNGNAGDDGITAGAGLNGLINLELNGGDNNDNIVGGDGVDIIHGGNGNDTIDANDNPAATLDLVFGDDGDDTMIWSPGKDDDMNEGGAGIDTTLVNGGGGGEQFSIVQMGPRVRFDRTNNAPAPFFIDIGTTERLQLNAADGADRVTTMPLNGTAQILDGGNPNTQPGDELIVIGFTGDASISPIAIPGFGPIAHSNFEFAPAAGRVRTFTAALDGAQEVPPVDTTGEGRGTVVLNAAQDQVTVQLSFVTLGGNITAAQIHAPAAPGSNAPMLFSLGSAGTTSGTLGPLTFAVTPQQAADLKAGLWYFNVRSTSDNNGEIRGQILADRVIEAFLTGAQVVPGVVTTATGFGTLTLAGTEDAITVTLNYIGLTGINSLTKIHGAAPRGQNAPAIVDLRTSGASSDTFTTSPIAVTPAQVAQIKRGEWYFEVQSTTSPNGEVRGQIDDAQFRDSFE